MPLLRLNLRVRRSSFAAGAGRAKHWRQNGDQMNRRGKLGMVLVVGVSVSCFGQWMSTGTTSQDVFVNVTIETPARYTLHEGIDVAINALSSLGKPLTVPNIIKELARMAAANDVKLPYTSLSSGAGRQKKRELEQMLLQRIRSAAKSASGIDEPNMMRFAMRSDYEKAYLAYKVELIDDEIRERYAKKMGGLNQYKRDMRNEAIANWKERFGTSVKNPNPIK